MGTGTDSATPIPQDKIPAAFKDIGYTGNIVEQSHRTTADLK